MKISSLPNNMPNISTINVADPVVGVVRPMDNPTVPKAEANSNIASIREQPAVTVMSNVPRMKRPK
ncbi:hypothetical protein SDC9_162156 [bioreactor metagenome]|uniref:Uncharacterized protein n=1 Tax=bioreactor metagenome TaxID=1076179 RepID=A0A645FK90_9ZZZZ